MLDCKNLSLEIENKEIFRNITFSLPSGEHLLILGPSGSGKSSLLSVLAGLQKASSGTVTYDNTEFLKLSMAQKDKFRAQNIGLIFQQHHLVRHLTVRENLQAVQTMSGQTVCPDSIVKILEQLDLTEQQYNKAQKLSFGQAQRVALARALLPNPTWIYCDEPTSALDDVNCDKAISLLKKEAENIHASLIIITHDTRLKKHFAQNQIVTLGGE